MQVINAWTRQKGYSDGLRLGHDFVTSVCMYYLIEPWYGNGTNSTVL